MSKPSFSSPAWGGSAAEQVRRVPANTLMLRSDWTPTSLGATLKWWAKADGPCYQDYSGVLPSGHGDPVGYLPDLSGNEMHGIQGTGAFTGGDDAIRPEYRTNVLNGKPGLFFYNTSPAYYLNLQKALFNGATEYTLALVMSMAAFSGTNRRFFGVEGTSRICSVSQQSSGPFLHGNTQFTTLTDTTGITSWSALSDRTVAVIVIRAKAGTGAEMYVNGILTDSETWASGAMATHQTVLLGVVNATASAATITPSSNANHRWGGYWHEGFALDGHYATDAELARVHSYLLRKWRGKLPYSRTAHDSGAYGHIQGICGDESGNVYVSDTSRLMKYDTSMSITVQNTSPFAGLPDSPSHIGDIDYYNGEIYATPSIGPTGACTCIAVYDADTLALDRYATVADLAGMHASACACAPEMNRLFIPQYYEDGEIVHAYKLSDLTYVGEVELSENTATNDGFAWRYPRMYFDCRTSGTVIKRCMFDGSGMESLPIVPELTAQGISFFPNGDFLAAHWTGGAAAYIWKWRPL